MDAPPPTNTPISPLRSVHTANFPRVLNQLGISLAVTTYQAGKLIIVRAEANQLNTHFCNYKKPMGLAADGVRLAVGTETAVWELRNMPAVARKTEPKGKHDACYLPRALHVTGDIDVHEMAWVGQDLWLVNTRFSCFCTLDPNHSFRPRWRPPFVTSYTPEDRCHLNGLGVRDGRPAYATALGETDINESWRENKARGGVLLDVTTDTVLKRGLSMPHSPRWHNRQLWFLESGDGSLATLDLTSGETTTVARLPGFTRGLDFYGGLAFVGLSQVRESAMFSGLPLTERLQERICGVWVINWQTGETVAFLRFEEAVQEIFAVQIFRGQIFPDVVEWGDQRLAHSYVLPDDALADVPRRLRDEG